MVGWEGVSASTVRPPAANPPGSAVSGPYFEDLSRGDVFHDSPAITLTGAHAVAHQAILGDRLRLSLDHDLSQRVTGEAAPVVHPALVWDVAIGHSSEVTRNVVANLFYRGLAFRRLPHEGDTLRTHTEVLALRQNSARPDRPPTGLVVLRIRTVDQHGRAVLDFRRCAMLPLRDRSIMTGHADDVERAASEIGDDGREAVAAWRLDAFRANVPGAHFGDVGVGTVFDVATGNVVSSAPELAHLTLNVAAVHHDRYTSPAGRLVYGGHTVGVALAQTCRVLPNLVTVLSWRGCDHLAPVREGDTLRSTITVEATEPLPSGGGIVWLRSQVRARAADRTDETAVLDWRFAGLLA